MKAIKQTAEQAIETAKEIITAAAAEFAGSIVAAKARYTIVIREQSAAMKAAGVDDKTINAVIREAVGDAVTPSTISRALTSAGVRLRGKRSDAGALRHADDLMKSCLQPKPEKAAGDEDGDEDGEGDDAVECLVEDGTKHTAETLAALLASLDPELVEQALEIAGLMDFMHG
jgi:hypothetical protein